jgi:hypothetical protein
MVERIIFTGYALWDYVLKSFLPLQLSIFYPYPMVGKVAKLPLVFYFYFIGWLGLAWFILKFFREQRAILFGLAFFFVTIFFNLPFFNIGYSFSGDRFTYLPYLGIFFIGGYYIDEFFKQRSMTTYHLRYWVVAALLGAVGLFNFPALYGLERRSDVMGGCY